MKSQIKKKRVTPIPNTPCNTSDHVNEGSCNQPLLFLLQHERTRYVSQKGWNSNLLQRNASASGRDSSTHVGAEWTMAHRNEPQSINDTHWLLTNQNIYIPYYAAHIIGSYTMNKEEFAQLAVESGVLPPLLDLLSGKISWVEQRVAVRALGHLASYKSTFESVAQHEPGFNLFTSGLC
ncbi:hypothetical protein JHK87_014264 [Glycine soja]|nr:hypothetical protein JHK87_014264 [Glycine soja]